MYIKAVFPGQYLQGPGVLNELPRLVSTFGKKGLILGSNSGLESIIPMFGPAGMTEQIPFERFAGECCEPELDRVAGLIRTHQADILIGMGGGKVIDTAKIAADRAGIPVIIVPTIASTDAPCSGCAVVYSPEGEFEKVFYQKRNPTVVLVDMNIIAHAPTRFLVAGMGDALATWFEARSCVETHSPNECGGLSTLAGLHIARLCYDILLKFGVQAKVDSEASRVTKALSNIAETNILLSGLGFESSGLAAAHAIHNGLTALEETHQYYHGEKVAFGLLVGLYLTGAPAEEIASVRTFCQTVGLPTKLADIGIDPNDHDKLMKVARKTCEPGSSIYHEAGEITPDKILEAIRKADRQ